MLRTRLLILLSAVALIVLLFNLPTVVVDNSESSIPSDSDQARGQAKSPDLTHNQEYSSEDAERVASLKALVELEENQEKTSIFADSLAELFLVYQVFDSAAMYFEKAATLDSSLEVWEKAGNAYYEAFTYSMDRESADMYGEKARESLQKVLTDNPQRLDLKTKVGMTLVSSSNPMQGITMLREVIAEDPDNEEALYNLGILAFQTGQFEVAKGRFENLVRINDDNPQGHFYLGLCYKELGENEKAKEQFLIVKEKDESLEVQATVDSYLKELE